MSHHTVADATHRTPLVPSIAAPPDNGGPRFIGHQRPRQLRSPSVEVRTIDPAVARPVERLECHLVAVSVDAATIHEVDFETIRLRPGQVLHVRPGQVHRHRAGRTCAIREVRIPPELVPDRLFPPGWYDPTPSERGTIGGPVPTNAAVVDLISADLIGADLIDANLDVADPSGAGASEIMTAGARYLLLRLARTGRPTPGLGTAPGDLVAALLGEIERSFNRSRAVGDYARSLGTTARTLSRATAALLDLSPKELVDRRVVLEAQRLLVVTAMPIAEVGEILGFTEATNFTKFFVRRCGVGPLDFRVDH